jgi:hypothetical protein
VRLFIVRAKTDLDTASVGPKTDLQSLERTFFGAPEDGHDPVALSVDLVRDDALLVMGKVVGDERRTARFDQLQITTELDG